MKRYNIFYKTKDKVIDRKNIDEKELRNILAGLKKEDESELRVVQVKDNENEEER